MRRLVCDRLRHDGFEVVEAADGRQLCKLITEPPAACEDEAASVDLILSDLRMPHCSGLQALAELQQVPCPPPFILMTAFGDDLTCEEASKLGARAVISKPFDLSELYGHVIAALTS